MLSVWGLGFTRRCLFGNIESEYVFSVSLFGVLGSHGAHWRIWRALCLGALVGAARLPGVTWRAVIPKPEHVRVCLGLGRRVYSSLSGSS